MGKEDGVQEAAEMNLLTPDHHRELVLELGDMRKQLDELKLGRCHDSPKPATKLGNPAVVGLAGFGLTTMVLQFHNIDVMESKGPFVWLGLVFGGLAQFIAGLQEFASGNNFGFSAFTTYGSFWISLGLMFIGNEMKLFEVNSQEVGYFLLAFTLYTGFMLIGTLGISVALFIVFLLLFIGFVLLDISHFHPVVVPAGHKHSVHQAQLAAGWILLLCALSAWYVMLHIIYMDIFQKNILPVGPPPISYITVIKILVEQESNLELLEF